MIFIGAAFITVGAFDLRPALLLKNATITSAEPSNKINWQPYSDEALVKARVLHKPVLIDFWADWCAACKELELYTFSSPSFQNMAAHFVLLKFDATNETEKLRELKNKYSLVGLPTLVIYDETGVFRKDLTVTEFLEAPALVTKMQEALKK